MNKDLILPATFALTVHAFVLFGLSGKRPAIVVAPGEDPPVKIDKTLEVERAEPVIATDDDDSRTPINSDENAVPRLPEIPVLHPPPWIPSVPIIPSSPGKAGVTKIPDKWDAPGRPNHPASDVYDPRLLDREPRARLQPAPVYPFELRKRRIEGTVVVEFLVDEAGNVYQAAVARATTPGFEDAALRAVAKWKFEPGRRSGRLVRFRMSVPVVFHLADD